MKTHRIVAIYNQLERGWYAEVTDRKGKLIHTTKVFVKTARRDQRGGNVVEGKGGSEIMKTNEAIDPMQAYLAGAFHGLLLRGYDSLKIVGITPGIDALPVGFEVIFASGLKLAVKVEVMEQPHGSG